jgi:hypothetical protein
VLWLQHAQWPAPLLPRATDLLQRLRLLQQLKSALLPGLLPLLGVPPAEATAAVPGLCIPQLLLLAEQRQQPTTDGVGSDGATEAEQQAAAMAAAAVAEQQLRLLLKRCRVLLPEDTARALCTLPATGPALVLLPERLGSSSREQLVSEVLAELSLAGPAAGSSAAPAMPTPQQQQQGKGAPAAAVAAALASQRASVAGMAAGSSSAADLPSWRQAVATLAAVLEAAALKASTASVIGSSSSVSSSNAEKAPPLPGGGPKVAAPGAGAAIAVPPEAAAAAAWQEACGDGVRQFSLASCKRAAAAAADAYRRNTPPLLPAAGHAVALQVGGCAAGLPTGHLTRCFSSWSRTRAV